MIYMLDTADLEAIKRGNDLFPISGVTTNPSIIAKENKAFFEIMDGIRSIIGKEKMIHAQAVGKTADVIVKEAEYLNKRIGGNLYVKIPVFPEGIKAMKIMKEKGINTTATAILTSQQALMAAEAGAEYLAPYINRADDICDDGIKIVSEIVELLGVGGLNNAKILGASFKNVKQVHETILNGAKSVTVNPETFERLLYHPLTDWSIDQFDKDWQSVYGDKLTFDL
ncbi:MAG TPA: fructose-6-phosphate aldolase [Victivallales bacterium]|nr:fructose-6-phosphate aldolase [Victivallales bacterium]